AAVRACTLAQRGLAPRGLWPGHTDGRTAFTATMRVAGRVHRGTAHGRPPAHPALTSGFTQLNVAVVGIADLPDRRHAALVNQTHFAAGHTHLSVGAFLRQQLCRNTCRARHLPALAGQQFNVMDLRPYRNIADRHGITGAQVGVLCTIADTITSAQAKGRDAVTLLAIGVLQQRDTRRAVGVVLNRDNIRHAVVLIASEVNNPVAPL